MFEETPQRQRLVSSNPINKLAEALAGIASQQRPQTSSAFFKPNTTNTLIFDSESEKFELFEDLFQTMLKMQPEMSEALKFYLFHSHFQKHALQIFRNNKASNEWTLEDLLIIFWRKNVRPPSEVTAKHKWHKLTFDPNTKSLLDFLEERNECAEGAFGPLAQQMIDCSLNAKLPPHLKWSINLAGLENVTCEQKVAHLEREKQYFWKN